MVLVERARHVERRGDLVERVVGRGGIARHGGAQRVEAVDVAGELVERRLGTVPFADEFGIAARRAHLEARGDAGARFVVGRGRAGARAPEVGVALSVGHQRTLKRRRLGPEVGDGLAHCGSRVAALLNGDGRNCRNRAHGGRLRFGGRRGGVGRGGIGRIRRARGGRRGFRFGARIAE